MKTSLLKYLSFFFLALMMQGFCGCGHQDWIIWEKTVLYQNEKAEFYLDIMSMSNYYYVYGYDYGKLTQLNINAIVKLRGDEEYYDQSPDSLDDWNNIPLVAELKIKSCVFTVSYDSEQAFPAKLIRESNYFGPQVRATYYFDSLKVSGYKDLVVQCDAVIEVEGVEHTVSETVTARFVRNSDIYYY